MKVRWTHTARQHLRAIHTYIAQDSVPFANRVVDRLTRRSIQIAEFPLSGRTVPEFAHGQIREVLERPYRLIYYIRADQIDVLAVLHAAQQLPSDK